jgi:hypothetical protein
MSAEVLYMLQAPACVYLPRVPGTSTERVLLGADATHRLYWAEATSPVAFLWGPRWWWVGSRLEFGIEFAPPVRYAVRDQARWELVSSDGRRASPSGSPMARHLVRSDGTVLAWGRTLKELSPGSRDWRVLTELPSPYAGLVLEAVALTDSDQIIEVYQDWQAFNGGPERGIRRDLTLLGRDSAGGQTWRVSLSLPEPRADRYMRHHLSAAAIGDTVLLFELWSEGGGGKGATYSAQKDGAVRKVNTFDVLLDGRLPVDVSATRDGAYFTTGQAVFRMNGAKELDLEPQLSACRWDGHTLYGVHRYPFFVSDSLVRENRLHLLLAAAREGIPRPDPGLMQSVRPYKEGWQQGHWILGGVDEAGREDEIVKFELP